MYIILYFADESETQDPTINFVATEPSPAPAVMKELKELKKLMKDVLKKQEELEKQVGHLGKALGANQFQLAKSSHAVSITNL